MLFLRRELVVVKLPGRIEAKAVDVEFLDPVKKARDQETLHLIAREVEVVGAPGCALPVGNGALEEVTVVVVAGQAGCILGKVDQHQVEDDPDSLAVKGVDEPLEVSGRSQPRGGGKEADRLVAPGGDVGVLEDPHQFDVRVPHVLDVGDQFVDQLHIGERSAILEAPRQGMDLVDVERSAKLVRERDLGVFELVVRLAKDRRAIDVVLQRPRKRIDAKLPAPSRFLHGELVVEPMVKAGDEALPDPGTPPPLHGVRVDVPVIEAAHDGDVLRVGGPDREANSSLGKVRTEEPMGPALLSHVEEIDVELGKGPEPGRVRWRLSVYRTGTDHGLVGLLDLHVVRRRLSVYRTATGPLLGRRRIQGQFRVNLKLSLKHG